MEQHHRRDGQGPEPVELGSVAKGGGSGLHLARTVPGPGSTASADGRRLIGSGRQATVNIGRVSAEAPTILRDGSSATAPTARPEPSRPTIPFLPGVEGLRGLALLAVLLYHNGFSVGPGRLPGRVDVLHPLGVPDHAAVDLGVLDHRQRISLRGFWSRRYRRLMPASLLCLAGVVVFGATVATPGQVASLRGDVLASLAYVANWRFIITRPVLRQPVPGPVAGAALLVAGHRGAVLPGVPVGVVAARSSVSKGSRRVGLRRAGRAVGGLAGQHAGALRPRPRRHPRVLRHRHPGARAAAGRPAGPGVGPSDRASCCASRTGPGASPAFVGAVVTLAPVGHAPPRPTRGSTRAAWPATP